MHTKNEIGYSLKKQMPYCTNHKCINYFEDSCMYLFEDGPLKINPMEYSYETCEAFISGKHPLYLEEILEITERYQALVEAVKETEKFNQVISEINQVISEDHSAFTQYNEGWQNATFRIKQAIENYMPQNEDKSKECIDRLTAAMEFLDDLNNNKQPPWISITDIEWERGNRYIDDLNFYTWYVSDSETSLIRENEYQEELETLYLTREIALMKFKKVLESEASNE